MSRRPPIESSVFFMDLRLPPDALEAAVELLVTAVADTRMQRGCRSCRVGVDAVERDRVCYQEEWTSEAALELRIRSDDFRRVLIAADLSAEEPRVMLGRLRGVGRMSDLAEVRAGTPIADLTPPDGSLARAPEG